MSKRRRIQKNLRKQASHELQQSTNQPHCPTCQSTNIEKIGMFKRMLSTSMFGIASDKVGKQWHCKIVGIISKIYKRGVKPWED